MITQPELEVQQFLAQVEPAAPTPAPGRMAQCNFTDPDSRFNVGWSRR
jgi:hypothetical protein